MRAINREADTDFEVNFEERQMIEMNQKREKISEFVKPNKRI